jgi:signal transduction histidine kinase
MRLIRYLFRAFIHFSILFSASMRLSGQTSKVVILKKEISFAHNNSDKLPLLISLLQESYSLERDTLYYYASLAKKIAMDLHDEPGQRTTDFYLALYLRREGFSDSSLQITNQILSRITYPGDNDIYDKFKLLQIDIISESGNSKDGIDSAFNFLKEAEKAGDTLLQIEIKSRIGSMYSDIGQYSSGLIWLYQAQDLSHNPLFDGVKNNSVLYFNIGLDYNYLGKFDSAEYYADRTIAISKASENLTMYAYGLGLKSYIYSYTNRVALAERPMNESVQLLKQIGGLYSVINAMSALAKYYASTGQPEKGIQTCLDALNLIRKYPIVPKEIIYNQLAENYKIEGNYVKYAETLNTIIRLRDSTYKKNSAEALATLNAKYDVSSKEAFIARQKLELLHKDIWIAGIAIASALILAAAYFFFRFYRRRQRIALAEAEEKERKRIAADLHDNIGAYASAISAGIDELETKEFISDPSSIHNLKNNVTEIIRSLRDTIWAFNKESISLTGISDRVKIYAQKIQSSYPHIIISVDENISVEKKLSPVQSLNIFRIIQESLHNALHHSHCSMVSIDIVSNGEGFVVTIKDNGDGFDPRTVSGQGNGLMNMKLRSAEAGLLLAIEKSTPAGMNISISSKGYKS